MTRGLLPPNLAELVKAHSHAYNVLAVSQTFLSVPARLRLAQLLLGAAICTKNIASHLFFSGAQEADLHLQ